MHFSLALAVLIAVAFFELFCEGAATAWSAVYTRHVGASSAIAAFVFAIYSLTMTAGRLRGDRIVLSQTRPGDAAGTSDDPYFASGLVFGDCYPVLLR